MSVDDDAREFAMLAATYTQQNPRVVYQENQRIAKEYGNIDLRFSIAQDNTLDRIVEVQNQLKHGFVKRDPRKILTVARMLSFIGGMREGTYGGTSVGLDDATVAVGMALESKAATGSDYGQLMTLVNDVRSAYIDMRGRANIPETYGFRQTVWQAAVQAGKEKGFNHYINTIRKGIDDLNTSHGTHAQVGMKARIIADLAVLDHFSKEHESEITSLLRGKGDVLEGFSKFYHENKGKNSAYAHRLPSIIR